MSQASNKLVIKYKTQIEEHITVAANLKLKIDSAKTNFKKKFYQKKLTRNNRQCAHVAMKLDKLLTIQKEAEKEKQQ